MTLQAVADAQLMPWETEFWGIKTALAERADVDLWAIRNGIELMWLLVPVERPELVQDAEEKGWRFSDIRLEMRTRPIEIPWPGGIREWREEDIPGLVQLARSSHRITRFYANPHLDNDRCDDLYEQWIRNSWDGWAQGLFVTDDGESYMTVHIDGEKGTFGLMAVPEKKRGQGIASSLMAHSMRWVYEQGVKDMKAIIQGANAPSQRLFLRHRFLPVRTDIWFYKWFMQ